MGVFAFGLGSPTASSRVISTPEPNTICFVTKGGGYLVNAEDPELWEKVVLRKNSMDDIDPSFECSAFAVCTLVFHSSGPRREVASSSTQSSSV